MNTFDIVIIGAGASGLVAARGLSKAGKQIALLEARNRLGGRIHTFDDPAFSIPLELGAEFVHGKLPITLGLLNEAALRIYETDGKFYRSKNGELVKTQDFMEHSGTLEKMLQQVEHDMTVDDFIRQYLHEEKYANLATWLRRYVEGYDAADAGRESIIAFRNEWENMGEESFRIERGYGGLIRFLAEQSKKHGCEIHLLSVVKEIKWSKYSVEITLADRRKYSAKKVLITLPLGVLASPEGSEGAIKFDPPIEEKMKAVESMGYGHVIKIFLEFKERFWENDSRISSDRHTKDLGFLLTDAVIPTWWTQAPHQAPVLTGWLGGPNAKKREFISDAEMTEEALLSLSSVYGMGDANLRELFVASKIINWTADPFSRGAYDYATMATPAAKKELKHPEEYTLFFAGEALYEGPEMGTVEAALVSGIEAVEKILQG